DAEVEQAVGEPDVVFGQAAERLLGADQIALAERGLRAHELDLGMAALAAAPVGSEVDALELGLDRLPVAAPVVLAGEMEREAHPVELGELALGQRVERLAGEAVHALGEREAALGQLEQHRI